jgi:hypothetical protein
MKRLILVLILLLNIIVSYSESKKSSNTEVDKIESQNLTIEVTKQGVFINSKRIDTGIDFSELKKVIGEPSRTKIQTTDEINSVKETMGALPNNIYTYDQYGILVYQKPNTKSISSITIDFKKQNHLFSPEKPFSGIMKINAKKIDLFTSMLLLKESIGLDVENTNFNVCSSLYNNYNLTFEFEDAKQKNKMVSLGIGINKNTEQANEKGWKNSDIEMVNATLRNNVQLIEYSKQYNFEMNYLLKCYTDKITTTIENKEYNNPTKENLKTISKILSDCIIQTSK